MVSAALADRVQIATTTHGASRDPGAMTQTRKSRAPTGVVNVVEEKTRRRISTTTTTRCACAEGEILEKIATTITTWTKTPREDDVNDDSNVRRKKSTTTTTAVPKIMAGGEDEEGKIWRKAADADATKRTDTGAEMTAMLAVIGVNAGKTPESRKTASSTKTPL